MVKFATCRGESHKQINTRRIREGTQIIKKVDLHPEFGMFLKQEVTVTVQEKMQAINTPWENEGYVLNIETE